MANAQNPTNTSTPLSILGTIIAIILLGLYLFSLGSMIYDILTGGGTKFSDGQIFILNSVWGLISALVIAQLGITRKDENPVNKFLVGMKIENNRYLVFLTWTYLIVWLTAGVSCLLLGVWFFPDSNETIKDMGTTWFGLAVMAGYAYFGLEPSEG